VLDGHFIACFGPRPLDSLTAEEVEEWAARPAWSSSTRHDYLGRLQTFLRWAKHPLALHRPPKESRGADTVLTDKQFAKVLSHATGDLKPLLQVLRETGARPQEIARLEAASIDWPNRCARLKHHKGSHRGLDRVVHFSAKAMRILRQQQGRYKDGLLFRTQAGTVFKKDLIVHRMAAIAKKVGFRAIAYSLRHTFCTRALEAGIAEAVVAAAVGHQGTTMLAKNYAHVGKNARVVKDAMELVSRSKAG
jgi:integrase